MEGFDISQGKSSLMIVHLSFIYGARNLDDGQFW